MEVEYYFDGALEAYINYGRICVYVQVKIQVKIQVRMESVP